MHVAGANYFLSTAFGGGLPEGIGRDLEQRVTTKNEAMPLLRGSVEHVGQVLGGLDESRLAETRKLFGREMTGYQVLLIHIGHGQEHLGQTIAYARSNGVPPRGARAAARAAEGFRADASFLLSPAAAPVSLGAAAEP